MTSSKTTPHPLLSTLSMSVPAIFCRLIECLATRWAGMEVGRPGLVSFHVNERWEACNIIEHEREGRAHPGLPSLFLMAHYG